MSFLIHQEDIESYNKDCENYGRSILTHDEDIENYKEEMKHYDKSILSHEDDSYNPMNDYGPTIKHFQD